jgi:hypothetical protein
LRPDPAVPPRRHIDPIRDCRDTLIDYLVSPKLQKIGKAFTTQEQKAMAVISNRQKASALSHTPARP